MSLKTLIIGTTAAEKKVPVARIASEPSFGVIGSVIKLDGSESHDEDGSDLTYEWSFAEPPPIGSRAVSEGFRTLDETGSVVSFSPDVVGEYVIQLVVSNGLFRSEPARTTVSVRAILVPHGRGLVPDGKFIWGYVRDIWSEVENKEWFETLWSALIQIAGAELLKAYQIDFNKSIRDIQDSFQRRWLKYEPKLALTGDFSFYLGHHCAGRSASTVPLDTYAVILSDGEVAVVQGTVYPTVLGETLTIRTSESATNLGTYELAGLNAKKNGYRLKSNTLIPDPTADEIVGSPGVAFYFDFQSKSWSIDASPGSDLALKLSTQQTLLDTLTDIPPMGAPSLPTLQGGDIIYYPSGPNAGFYRVVEVSGSYVIVDRAPPSYSDTTTSATYKAYVYRPVLISVSQPDVLLTDNFFVPYQSGDNDLSQVAAGRLVVVGDQSFTISRSIVDTRQRLPVTVVTVDRKEVPTGIGPLNWRAPHTLVSKEMNFEELGVSPGDLLVWDLLREGTSLVAEVRTQVVGVDRGRIGFVLSTAEVVPGEIPELEDDTLYAIAQALQIEGAVVTSDGQLVLSDDAEDLFNEASTVAFRRSYWNVELTPDSDIVVDGITFRLRPRHVIRNKRVPVDETVLSIPALQEFIVEPTVVERDGKLFHLVRGTEYEIERRPVALSENADYVVDGQKVFKGEMRFRPGTKQFFADGADFLDRSVQPGDILEIHTPSALAGKYVFQSVIGRHSALLTRSLPTYFDEWATGRVTITRRKTGNFIRFAPGVFTAANPAPERLWAEVTFFDNRPTIERNFGILVGLTRDALDDLTSNLSYRQAVSGLMYAYSQGPEMDRVRLGAQILLGLPFAEHRGIVRSIEPVYRLDLEGNPKLGRILVEDIDSTDTPMGTMRAYTYPLDPESEDLAGLDTNPETGAAYAVGDVVERFAPLCKGVQIVDYLVESLTTSENAIKQLQQFHSLKVRVNDSLFGFEEIQLVSSFLKKITPHYISVYLASLTNVGDDVTIKDDVAGGVIIDVIDDASFGIPTPLVSGAKTLAGLRLIRTDGGVMSVRREGRDLVTAFGSSDVSSAAGGFLTPQAHEEFDGDLCRAGDKLLIFEGDNAGLYEITAVPADGEASVAGAAFASATGQRFAILRPMSALLKTGSSTRTNGNPVVVLSEGGIRTDLVAAGDWLVIGDRRYTILRVGPAPEITDPFGVFGTTPELAVDEVLVSPTPDTSGTAAYRIYRPAFLGNPHDEEFEITGDGTNTPTAIDDTLKALLETGDEIQVQDDSQKRYFVVSPKGTLFFSPEIPVGTHTVKICKPDRPGGPVGLAHRRLDPTDSVDVAWVEDQNGAACVNGSAIVNLSAQRTTAPAGALTPIDPSEFCRPGDLLVLGGNGNGAVDVGYGAGVYPVSNVSSTEVILTVALTVTESVPWTIRRVRSL